MITHYAGNVYAWDVVNEAFNIDGSIGHTVWCGQPAISGSAGAGTKHIEQALIWARQADPNAQLFYNDHDAEEITNNAMPFTPWLRILSAVVFRSTASGSKPTSAVG